MEEKELKDVSFDQENSDYIGVPQVKMRLFSLDYTALIVCNFQLFVFVIIVERHRNLV